MLLLKIGSAAAVLLDVCVGAAAVAVGFPAAAAGPAAPAAAADKLPAAGFGCGASWESGRSHDDLILEGAVGCRGSWGC